MSSFPSLPLAGFYFFFSGGGGGGASLSLWFTAASTHGNTKCISRVLINWNEEQQKLRVACHVRMDVSFIPSDLQQTISQLREPTHVDGVTLRWDVTWWYVCLSACLLPPLPSLVISGQSLRPTLHQYTHYDVKQRNNSIFQFSFM